LNELRYILGGPQGGGLETSSQVLSWAFAREGYGVSSDREYFSNIKGRHSYIHATISASTISPALSYPVHLVGAMDSETVFTHMFDLDDGGYLIYNSDENSIKLASVISMEPEFKEKLLRAFDEIGIDGSISSAVSYLKDVKKINVVALSYRSLLSELQKQVKVVAAQASRYISTILIGAVAAMANIDDESLNYAFKIRFKSGEIYEHNVAFSRLIKNYINFRFSLDRPNLTFKKFIISGNDAVAMGKVAGGLRFQSYYPITPAADESFTLEEHERLGNDSVVVFQTEDELGAIAAAIGASLSGARSATSTSGPGFDLMVEGLGWAGMNEVPVVVTYYQRGGPSTGQPTRGGQSDLLSSVFASHGEYPRIVLASGDHEEAFYDAIDALNFAERFQTPVIHLVDKFLANEIATMRVPDLQEIKIDRGKLAPEGMSSYRRFDLSSNISPRAFLGQYLMWYTGDEHNEMGHITEESENRIKLMNKRMGKEKEIEEGIPEERRFALYGDSSSDVLLIGWGFVKTQALKALEDLKAEGIKASYINIRTFIPFPTKTISEMFKRYDPERIITVEHNYEAQAAKLIAMNTGNIVRKNIVKYTGRPIYSNELRDAVKRILSGSDREVLSYGA